MRPSLSDTTLAVSVLNTLDGHTSGAVNASNITTLTGAASDLNTAYASATASPASAMRPSPSPTPPSRSPFSTPSTAIPQAPSMPATSPHSPAALLI